MFDFFYSLYNSVLGCRYKLILKGEDLITNDTAKLILPNHISHMDPQLMTIILRRRADYVPVVAEGFSKIPIIRSYTKRYKAILVPKIKKGNRDPEIFKRVSREIIKSINNGRSALIFPAGQLSYKGIEKIGGKQAAHNVVLEMNDSAKVIGVRITGLYGSMWSTAWNGKRPEFFSTFVIGGIYFLANLFVLVPRRKVVFEFVDITDEAKEKAAVSRKEFNGFLEEFYNANGAEKPKFIRHLFFFPRIRNKIR